MSEEKSLTVYVMGEEDINVGFTGRLEAPIALVIPKAHLGIGLPIPIAVALHNALCHALALIEEQEDETTNKNLLN